MKTMLVRFHTKEDIRLDGLLFEPVKKTNKIVINIHGTADYFYRQRYLDDVANQLADIGYACLTFDNRGSHEEYDFIVEKNNKRVGTVVIGANNEIFEDCLLDIEAAVSFAKSKGYCEIVLMGHSYGCNKIVYYAAQTNFCGKLILLAPCDMLEHSKSKEANPSGKHFRHKSDENFDIFRYGNKTVPQKYDMLNNDMLVEIGEFDDAIFQENKQDCIDYIKSTFKKSKVMGHIIKDTGHCYTGKGSELAQNIVSWLI